jgi:tetratricopeptide (TPR) repeat protein
MKRAIRTLFFTTLCITLWGCPTDPQPGEFAPIAVSLKEVHGENKKELLDETLVFVDSAGVIYTAPKGTWTDGASVPRLALWLTDGRFQESFLKAAIVHDAYCQEFNKTRCKEQYRKLPWRQVHWMFYEACLAGKTDPMTAKLMYAAVWWGGPKWDAPQSDLSTVPDEMLSVSYQGCKHWIKANNPEIKALDTWMSERSPIVVQAAEDQARFLAALEQGNLTDADLAQQQAEMHVDAAIQKFPKDTMLQNLQGYNHKNRAIRYQQKAMPEEFEAELQKAHTSFSAVLKIDPREPSALNGLGSVSILRGDLDQAEKHIQNALQINPDYPAAQHDLELIKQLRRDKESQLPIEKRPLTTPQS